MQNKGIIWVFTILLSLASLYQISFSWVANKVEKDAAEYANGDISKEEAYLDSMTSVKVYPVLGFTYGEVRKMQINLGLDLKGGMNVVLEVSVEDIVKALSSNSKDPSFIKAIKRAKELQKQGGNNFVESFGKAWDEVAPNKKLAGIFYTLNNKGELSPDASNDEVLNFLRKKTDAAFESAFNVIRTRVNVFGVAQPNIQKLEASDRILVELPGVKNKENVRQLLQGAAKLEFWNTYESAQAWQALTAANDKLVKVLGYEELTKDSTSNDSTIIEDAVKTNNEETVKDSSEIASKDSSETSDLLSQLSETTETNDSLANDSTANTQMTEEERKRKYPLLQYIQPNLTQEGQYQVFAPGPVVGFVHVKDTGAFNKYLRMPEIQSVLPKLLRLKWYYKPTENGFLALIACKAHGRSGEAVLQGDLIKSASTGFDQFSGAREINMVMKSDAAKAWKNITREASKEMDRGAYKPTREAIAVVLDNTVYSHPVPSEEIGNGSSRITGDFDQEEAELLVNILTAGQLPAPAKIVEENIVGPSLGQESIQAGLRSFIIALIIVLLYMIFYYAKAGIASNVALIANMFFILGVLASTNVALTLPGIAGIVLTIGMSVDANVLIYERIREELAAGKSLRLAITDGYKNAYSSIIDANVTTLLTGFVLWVFGTGPIEGFAITLVIGIFTSLFSAIFITRLMFEWFLDKDKKVTFSTKITEGAFKNVNFDFLKHRMKFYVISGLIIAAGIASLVTKGLNYGVDFSGGRNYIVRFEEPVSTLDLTKALAVPLETAPEVKTFGASNQVKITTNYLIDSEDENADHVVEEKLHEGLQKMNLKYEILSSQKVGPTIADDIKTAAFWSILISLIIIFLYIVFRFRRWQFGLGALVALFHDVLVVLSVFSIFYGILPFSLEIDQAFIAAILTVVGYSINDTVVVFDRIREYLGLHKKQEMNEVLNNALNSTLSRTINTSLSTIFVLLMIFIFGGEVIRGFSFALLVGVIVGTYSSLCVATPVMVDFAGAKRKTKKK